MKRFLSIILSISIVFCVFSSCNTEEATQSSSNAENTSSVAEQQKPIIEEIEVKACLTAESTTVFDITSSELFAALVGERTPSNAILHLDDELFVTAKDGLYVPFDAALAMCQDRVIPIFYVESEKAATALGETLNEIDFFDCIVMSDKAELVKSVRKLVPSISGAIDARSNELDGDLSYLIGLRDEANSNNAKIIFLGSHATSEQIVYLQNRLMTVWIDTKDNSVEAHCNAFNSGANGTVSESSESMFETIDLFEKDTLFRDINIVGHRGQPATNADNSLSGAKAAVDSGANAVECDIYLTADMEFVIMHSDDIGYYTEGKGKVSELRTFQVQYFPLKGTNGEHIPKLEEFFEEFRGVDMMHTIEIKTTHPDTVYLLRDLIAKCGVAHQVNIISFNFEQLKLAREIIPNVSCGYLGSINGIYSDIAKKVNPYNISYHPTSSNMNASNAYELNNRGISVNPWNYSSKETLYDVILNGYSSYTTDGALWAKDFVNKIVPLENYSVTAGDEAEFKATAITKLGEKEVYCEPIVINGDVSFTKTEKGYIPSASGDVTVMLKFADQIGEKTVYRYSESVKLTVK